MMNNDNAKFVQPVQELSTDEESILEQNIVWIFASARSGTTWLGTELLSYGTHIMSEPYITNLLGLSMPGGAEHNLIRIMDQRENDPNYFFSKEHQTTWMHFLRKLILNRVYSQFRDLSTKIIMKEIISVGASDIIAKCMPQSKIIILLRDGRDVIDSYLDSRSDDDSWLVKSGMTILSGDEKKYFMKLSAQSWVKTIEILMKTYEEHASKNRIMIRYEELRKDTIGELQKIYEFLQINIPKSDLENIITKYSFENIPNELKGKGKFRRFAIPGKWSENLSIEEKNVLEQIMGSTLKQLGYN